MKFHKGQRVVLVDDTFLCASKAGRKGMVLEQYGKTLILRWDGGTGRNIYQACRFKLLNEQLQFAFMNE